MALDELVGKPQVLPNLRQVRRIEVIETVSLEGTGTAADPFREITRYWAVGGDSILLAERDSLHHEPDFMDTESWKKWNQGK